jgi:predicted amidophosphoribosyltransferase
MEMRCPTCRAPWRGAANCGRCGTDLTTLMCVETRAWELREAARQALTAGGRAAEAVALAQAACRLHATPQGLRLLALALIVAGQGVEAQTVVAQALSVEEALHNVASVS